VATDAAAGDTSMIHAGSAKNGGALMARLACGCRGNVLCRFADRRDTIMATDAAPTDAGMIHPRGGERTGALMAGVTCCIGDYMRGGFANGNAAIMTANT
jgi:hypothetical protein